MVIFSQIIEIWLSGNVVLRVRGPHLSFLWFDIANRTRVIGRRLVDHNHNWAPHLYISTCITQNILNERHFQIPTCTLQIDQVRPYVDG